MSYDTNNFQNFNNYVNELPTSTPRGGAASSAALNSDFRINNKQHNKITKVDVTCACVCQKLIST